MAESNPTFYEEPADNNPFTDEPNPVVVNFKDECTWKAFVFAAGQDEYFDDIDEVM